MNVDYEARLRRIEDCRELYLKYAGQSHEQIEHEMRAMGHVDFHRRILYRRFERGRCRSGWIERFGWDALLKVQNAKCKMQNEAAEAEPYRTSSGNAASTNSTKSTNSTNSINPTNSKNSPDFDEFQKWLKAVSPSMVWTWKHQIYIYKKLKRVTDGLCKRLMIFMPPRHGKSELVTVRYSAWRLKKDPSLNIILGSYTQHLASRFSRKIRKVLMDDADFTAATQRRGEEGKKGGTCADPAAFNKGCNCDPTPKNSPSQRLCVSAVDPGAATSPFPFIKARPANTVAEWETTEGGGLRAVGVGGGVTGFGAGLIVIDDPVKSRAEAESEHNRERIWNWFNDDIYTRLEPNGAIILIQTRWHEDDLAGRLLKEAAEEDGEQWDVVNLPALAEAGNAIRRNAGTLACQDAKAASEAAVDTTSLEPRHANTSAHHAGGTGVAGKGACVPADPLGRNEGEALCPERYDEDYLKRTRRKLGSYSFAALYQQRPVPAEGGLFKRGWFKIIPHAPPNLRWKRGTDPGISGRDGADYTASLRVAYDGEGNMYIDGGFRKRIEYPELRRYILGRIETEQNTEHGVELSANGNAVVQDLRREPRVRGRAFRGIPVKGDKISRALPWLALAEEGRVFLIRATWNHEFLDEAASFPLGTHDDQIDAVSLAVHMHSRQNNGFHVFD